MREELNKGNLRNDNSFKIMIRVLRSISNNIFKELSNVEDASHM